MQRRSRRRTASHLPGLDIAEHRSWRNFLAAAQRFHAAMDRDLTVRHQLSAIDLRVLNILSKSATGAARMAELADSLAATRHHMTKRIRELEGRGLVRREANPVDRRGVVAVITDDGRDVKRQATVTYARGVHTHLVGLLSRRQLTTVAENCGRINARLKAASASA